MAVLREANLLGNQRVDIPHLRGIESAVRGDFDLLAGAMMAGKSPLVVSGFYVLSTGVTIASNLKIRVADSSLIHFLASESGSIFHVPADRPDEQLNSTNPRVLGSFTPGTVNYVGLDFVREADDTTIDLVEFIDSDSELETPVQVPLARTSDYRIVISTLDFENNPGVCPVAKVTLDDSNNITNLVDSRQGAFRLGSGGTLPNIKNSFAWPAGRAENLTGDTFVGGDKAIQNFKDWMDAVMSRIWEVGGGEYWYSPTTPMNEKLARSGDPFVSNGEYFEWDGTNLHWKGLVWIFANSTGVYNLVQNQTTDQVGLTDLLDGECIYVDVDRAQVTTVSAAKGSLTDLGTPELSGSRYVLAWARDVTGLGDIEIFTRDQSYMVNGTFKNATVAAAGMVKLSASSANGASPNAVATVDAVSFEAKAAGLSRGFRSGQLTPTLSTDFIGGAGDIQIGGGNDGADGTGGGNSVDYNVFIRTGRLQDETKIIGNGTAGNGVAALMVQQVSVGGNNRIVRLRNGNEAEDKVHFFNDGSIGLVPVVGGTPFPPAPVVGAQIRAKYYLCTNGLATPNTKDQFCIMWHDGSVVVIAESPTY